MKILLTGATGQVGSELLLRLVAAGHSVIGFVHTQPQVMLASGATMATEPFDGTWPPAGKAALLRADISVPQLGLDQAEHLWLAESVDVIVHCAAVTAFGLADAVYDRVNVEGVRNIVALMTAAGRDAKASMLYVSTAYVCGERSGLILERDGAMGQSYGNAYERSKAAAEAIIDDARRQGLRIAVARPSIVVGASGTGEIRDFENIYILLRLTTEGRIRHWPANSDASLDLVPIDYVADRLAGLVAKIDEACGQNGHLQKLLANQRMI